MALGIDKYNAECRSIVMRYANEWESTVTRMGRWIDFKNDYKTLYPSFMESVWYAFMSRPMGTRKVWLTDWFACCCVQVGFSHDVGQRAGVPGIQGDAILHGVLDAAVQL